MLYLISSSITNKYFFRFLFIPTGQNVKQNNSGSNLVKTGKMVSTRRLKYQDNRPAKSAVFGTGETIIFLPENLGIPTKKTYF